MFTQLDLQRHVLVLNDRIVEELQSAQNRVDNYDAVRLLDHAFLTFQRLGILLRAQPLLLLLKVLHLLLALKDHFCLELEHSNFALLELDQCGKRNFLGEFGVPLEAEVHVTGNLLLS